MPRLLSIAILLSLVPSIVAQDSDFKPKKLTLNPAKAPVPALKYRLLPPVSDLEPGNAVTFYFRAAIPSVYRRLPEKTEIEMQELMDLPIEEFIRAKKPSGRELPIRSLEEVDQGARREFCNWELLPRLRKDGWGSILPEVQDLRRWVMLLGYRARLEIANGEFDKATYTIQTMLGMSRHVAEGPTLISSLVGMFSAASATDRVEDLVQMPTSANLYWALSALPRPMIDIRKGFESERIAFDGQFPELKEIETRRLSQKELDRLANLCWGNELSGGRSSDKEVAFSSKLLMVGLFSQQYPGARKALIDQGRKAEEIDALPVLQVVLTHNYQQYKRVMDDLLKWTYLPYWEGHEERKKIEAEYRAMKLIPFGTVIPAVEKVYQASIRPDRKIAVLRCVEALRMHVAETGKVPATLDEIKIVPIPIDPVTGKQFQYKAVGDVVTFYAPPPAGVRAHEGNAIHYEITMKH